MQGSTNYHIIISIYSVTFAQVISTLQQWISLSNNYMMNSMQTYNMLALMKWHFTINYYYKCCIIMTFSIILVLHLKKYVLAFLLYTIFRHARSGAQIVTLCMQVLDWNACNKQSSSQHWTCINLHLEVNERYIQALSLRTMKPAWNQTDPNNKIILKHNVWKLNH